MLQALLLAALVAAPLGSAALFVPARLIDRGTGTWPARTARGARRDRHGRAGRGGGRRPAAARGDRAQPGGRGRGRGGRQPDLAAGDQALVGPRSSVLGLGRVPVRRVPGLRDRVDLPQQPRAVQHRGRCAALGARGLRRRAELRVPLGTLRRAGHPALAAADHAQDQAVRAGQRAPHGQPARPGAQRAAGHGHRNAALPAPPGLPALRDHPDRRQHRRRGPLAAGGGLVRAAPRSSSST